MIVFFRLVGFVMLFFAPTNFFLKSDFYYWFTFSVYHLVIYVDKRPEGPQVGHHDWILVINRLHRSTVKLRAIREIEAPCEQRSTSTWYRLLWCERDRMQQNKENRLISKINTIKFCRKGLKKHLI
jgi:hypothetical protein